MHETTVAFTTMRWQTSLPQDQIAWVVSVYLLTSTITTPLYGNEAAGTWQCHEVHVRLDDPGQANGLYEVRVNGQLEVALDELTFVDDWAGAGLNNVRFASYWKRQTGLDHHVDDVVIATVPIGCPGG